MCSLNVKQQSVCVCVRLATRLLDGDVSYVHAAASRLIPQEVDVSEYSSFFS